MSETCFGEDAVAVRTSPAEDTKIPVLYDRVEQFVAHVIYDGRFLETFTSEPLRIAALLGVELAPDVAAALQGRDRGKVLAEVTEVMTGEYRQRAGLETNLPDIRADVGAIIGASIAGTLVVVVVVEICRNEVGTVVDTSRDAEAKL